MTQNNDPVQEAVERLLEDSVKGVGPRFPLGEVNKKHIKLALRTKIKPLLREAQREAVREFVKWLETSGQHFSSEADFFLSFYPPTEPARGEG